MWLDVVECGGVGWDGMVWDEVGLGWCVVVWSRMRWDGMERDRDGGRVPFWREGLFLLFTLFQWPEAVARS